MEEDENTTEIELTTKDLALKSLYNPELERFLVNEINKAIEAGEDPQKIIDKFRLAQMKHLIETFGANVNVANSAAVAQINHAVETGDLSVLDKPVVKIKTASGTTFIL